MTYTLEIVRTLSKNEIMANRFQFWLDDWNARDIDLGDHKHDRETMTFILSNLGKYYFIEYIALDNFIHYESLAAYLSEHPHECVATKTALAAIDRFRYGKDLFCGIIRNSLNSGDFASRHHSEFESRDAMIAHIFNQYEHLGDEILGPAKDMLRDEAHRHLLPTSWGD